MKTFVTVIQTGSNTFDVFKFTGNSILSIYPKTSKLGVTMTVWESNADNDKYCFDLVDKMNSQYLPVVATH